MFAFTKKPAIVISATMAPAQPSKAQRAKRAARVATQRARGSLKQGLLTLASKL